MCLAVIVSIGLSSKPSVVHHILVLGGLLPLRNGNNSFLNIFGLRALNSDFDNVGL